MKRTISLWLGLLAFRPFTRACANARRAYRPQRAHWQDSRSHHRTGRRIKNLRLGKSLDRGGHTKSSPSRSLPQADYAGEANVGTYTVVYRAADTPPDKFVDSF